MSISLPEHEDHAPDLAFARNWAPAMPFGDGFIGMCPGTNAAVQLNGQAAMIWNGLRAGDRQAEIVRKCAEAQPGRAEVAWDDVSGCIEAFDTLGLFEPVEPPPPPVLSGVGGRRPEAWFLDRHYRANGKVIRVRIGDAELGILISALMQDFPQGSGPADADVIVPGGTSDTWDARSEFLARFYEAAGGGQRWLALLHGACMRIGQVTALFCAPGGSGKSTLCANLARAGWRMLAEDITAIDSAMRVVPLPFALSVKSGSWQLLEGDWPQIGHARSFDMQGRQMKFISVPGPMRAAAPSCPNLVILPRYAPDEPGSIERLAPLEMLELVLNEESRIHLDHPRIRHFFAWAERVPAFALTYGSSAEAKAQLVDIMAHLDDERRISHS